MQRFSVLFEKVASCFPSKNKTKQNKSMPPKKTAAAPVAAAMAAVKAELAEAKQEHGAGVDILASVVRIFSDVHQSSTTHADSKKALLKLLDARTLEETLDAIKKVTVAACVSLNNATVTRHSKFLHQVFSALNERDRERPTLYMIHGIYVYHNVNDDAARHNIVCVLVDLVKCLSNNGTTASWFGDFVEALKMRVRDKYWPVREKCVHLLSCFVANTPDDDITQLLLLVSCEDTRTEVRRMLLRCWNPKSIYFPHVVRFLDDKVSAVRKQAWILFGQYNWPRVENYSLKFNMSSRFIAAVARGLADSTRSVAQEAASALKKWAASKQPNPATEVELLEMIIGKPSSNVNSHEQHAYIAAVADHLYREHDSDAERKKKAKAVAAKKAAVAAAAATNSGGASSASERGADNNNDNTDGAADGAKNGSAGGNLGKDADKENAAAALAAVVDGAEPLPYPLTLKGMSVGNVAMWAAHARAAVAAGKTDLEERLLPTLRNFANYLGDVITAFHYNFEAHRIEAKPQFHAVQLKNPEEAELVLHVMIRSFMMYKENGYVNHIDHESSEALSKTFIGLLVTTMDPPHLFCNEAMEAVFAISHRKNVGDLVTSVITHLFRSLHLTQMYGLSIDDSETFGRKDRDRRAQHRELEKREEMFEMAQMQKKNMLDDDLYMNRMQRIILEYLSCRSRADKSHLPVIVDQVIRLGREWGGDPEVKTISTRALGMACLVNPSIVPTYIGLLLHNASSNVPQRLAAMAASFDILCEFGAGFFRREERRKQQEEDEDEDGDGDDGDGDDGEDAALSKKRRRQDKASFDVQYWERYVTQLQTLTVNADPQVRRLAVIGVSKMLSCNRLLTDSLPVGMALVHLHYVAPNAADLSAMVMQGLGSRRISAIQVQQEKCQAQHAAESFTFFLRSFSSSAPKRMRQTLDGGIIALKLLLTRALNSNAALDAAAKFIRRLVSFTDSCSLELVRDIDPRLVEAAKERMEGTHAHHTNTANDDMLDAQATLSLPPLQDESGNDLYEAARSNPTLWGLLAMHSLHEVLAEFLLECVRDLGALPAASSAPASARSSGRASDASSLNNSTATAAAAAPLATAVKLLCARSLASLQLYKRDPESVSTMSNLIVRTASAMSRYPDIAGVVTRFGAAYGKACGQKKPPTVKESESGRPSFAATAVALSRESSYEKLRQIAGTAVDGWFASERLTDSINRSAGGGSRRGRNSGESNDSQDAAMMVAIQTRPGTTQRR